MEGCAELLQGTSIQGYVSSLLELCQGIQRKASPIPNPFLLHPTKCLCLATSYSLCVNLVLDSILSISSSPLYNKHLLDKLISPLSALLHAIQEGHNFLDDCLPPLNQHQQHWLINKALHIALSTDIVYHHLHDLVWCMSVLRQSLDLQGFALQEARRAKKLHHLLKDTWDQSEEDQDVRSMQVFLVNMASENEEVCHVAKFISRRLSLCKSEGKDLAHEENEVLRTHIWVDPSGFTRGDDALGRGAFAEIFKTLWMGGRFACKDLFHVEDEEIFKKEAFIQARLRHPNVVHLVCCTKSASVPNKCSLVMELMHQDLRSLIIERMRSGMDAPFSLLAAVDLMLQIAMGMEYLHALHIMHRDLKSNSILVCPPFRATYIDIRGHVRVKIADFGMSKSKQSSMYSSKDVGATPWRAPEVFEVTSGRYTRKADVYSFAMVCYEILTGQLPSDHFRCKLKDLHRRLLEGDRPNLPQSCPPVLASYIQRCWHGDALKRPTFKHICTVLRYLKSCILLDEMEILASPFPDNMCDVGELHISADQESSYHPVLNIQSEMHDCRTALVHDDIEKFAEPGQGLFCPIFPRIERSGSVKVAKKIARGPRIGMTNLSLIPNHETATSSLNLPRATLPDPFNSNQAYIFAGKHFIKIKFNQRGADELIFGPRVIDQYWTSLRAANFSVVDAALPFPGGGGMSYIFSGDQYISIMHRPDTRDSFLLGGPQKTLDYWPSLCKANFERVDAVFPRPGASDEVYFFSGKLYVVIKVIPNTFYDYIIRGPLVITEQWPSLKEAGFSTLDAVLPNPKSNNEAYFFSKNLCALIEVEDGSYVDRIVKEPLQVRRNWPSLRQAGFY